MAEQRIEQRTDTQQGDRERRDQAENREKAGERQEQVAQNAKEATAAVREVARTATSEGPAAVKESMAAGADQLQKKAQDAVEQLRNMSPEDAREMFQSALEWTRKEPAYALGGALALGFLVGKMWGRLTSHKG